MKLDYFFPVFKDDSAKTFLTSFIKSKFFVEHSDYNIFFVVESSDQQNIDFLSSEALRHPEYKVIVADKSFTYNDAFSLAIKYFKGEVVLLGDMKLARNDLIFESCLQKKQKNASVVHVVKKRTGFKGFWFNLFAKVYNFFIKIYTGKKDRLNIISLGLIDKNIVELLQVLPNKRCFIKNTKDLKGFETRTIYVSPTTKVYKPSFKKKTGALTTFFVSLGVFFVSLLAAIFVNALAKNLPPIVNIFLVFIMFASLILCVMNLPKHFYDCRNKDFLSYEIETNILNGDQKDEKSISNNTDQLTKTDVKSKREQNKIVDNVKGNNKTNKKPATTSSKTNKNSKVSGAANNKTKGKSTATRQKSTKQVRQTSKTTKKSDTSEKKK